MIKPVLFATTALLMLGSTAAHAEFCREFTSTVTIGNRLQEGVGTACLNPDGSWQVVSGPGVGSTFYDNGPNGYGANNVTYVQPTNTVYYQQPQVNYVMRERAYVPRSTIIISNGYRDRYPRHYASYNYRPWWNKGYNGRGHDHHDHHDRGHDRGRSRR